MTSSILALATAVPSCYFLQTDIAEKMIYVLNIQDENKQQQIRRIYQNSAIYKRHSILPDFHGPRSEWHFWGHDYPSSVPGMSRRNEIYKREAPRLAHEAANKALKAWGRNAADITHVISVSCTGIMAPGIEFDLIRSLGLKRSVNRFGINFMGCFGAFKGLAVAQAFAKENPAHRILVVCTELCSLHLQTDLDAETITANSLFGDGAGAFIIGTEPCHEEKSIWDIINYHSIGLEQSLDKMSWEASDRGFLMRLSHTVPVLIGRHIQPFIENLIAHHYHEPLSCDWAVHPGGKSILQAIEKAMKLEPDHTKSAWDTLDQYGNMSSSTFIFVLENLLQRQSKRDWTLGIGFGPGLSMEGILLKKGSHS